MDELPGQRHAPSGYTRGRQIGRGSTAVVYEAIHDATGDRIALKMWLAPLDFAAQKRFQREIFLLRELADQPNIVRLHAADPGDARTPAWMATDLFTQSLQERYEQGPVPLAEAYRVTDGVLAGLEAIHDLGHLHRDIKPANILIDADRVVLCDLGILATVVDDTDHIGAGTIVAPEVAQLNMQPSIRSDIFALACTLYGLFTPDIPPRLSEVLVRASSTRFSDRPENVRTLRRQIAEACDLTENLTPPKQDPPHPQVQEVAQQTEPAAAPRRRILRFIGALSALLLISTATFGAWRYAQSHDEHPLNPAVPGTHTPSWTTAIATPGPSRTTEPINSYPVTLSAASGPQVTLTAIIHEPPAAGRSYWLVIELFYPNTDPEYVEYYARWHLPSKVGTAEPRTITFEGGADPSYRRTARIVSASESVARRFQYQLDSPQNDTPPLQAMPCDDCTVSEVLAVTPR
jgi:serine/threonine protein kinase